MSENELPGVSSAGTQIEAAGTKAVEDIITAHENHKTWARATLDEMRALGNELLTKLEDVSGLHLGTQDNNFRTTSELKDSLLAELESISLAEIEPEVLISLAVKMVKRAAALDPNAKVKFEQAYEAS